MRNVHRWIDEAEARQLEWMIVISEGAQRGRGRSVFEKMKGEAGKKEEQVWILCFFPFFCVCFCF